MCSLHWITSLPYWGLLLFQALGALLISIISAVYIQKTQANHSSYVVFGVLLPFLGFILVLLGGYVPLVTVLPLGPVLLLLAGIAIFTIIPASVDSNQAQL